MRTVPLRIRHCCHAVLCVIVGSSLVACATTGDPRKGGLFGWSENKATTRQAQLQDAELAQRRRAAAEGQRSDALHRQQNALSGEARQLQAELDALQAENRRLDEQLRGLMRKRQLGAEETQRLSAVLAENQDLLSKTLAAPVEEIPLRTAANDLNDQNGRLHRELLALLHH